MNAALTLIRRDLRLAFRHGIDSLLTVAFFCMAVTLFPFGVGPEPGVLARIAPGVVWVAALLSVLLSLERLFQADHQDGSLELLALDPIPLEILVLAKVAAHWLITGLPLILAAPLFALFMGLPADGLATLVLALLIGTPLLNLIGAVGAALILGARRGGVLLALLILPLYVPALIFGVAAVEAVLTGLDAGPHLLIQGAMLLAATALCPWAAAAALRQALE